MPYLSPSTDCQLSLALRTIETPVFVVLFHEHDSLNRLLAKRLLAAEQRALRLLADDFERWRRLVAELVVEQRLKD